MFADEIFYLGLGACIEIKVVGTPIKLGETPASARHAPPLLGQHNDEILESLGYRKEEIVKLRSDNVIR